MLLVKLFKHLARQLQAALKEDHHCGLDVYILQGDHLTLGSGVALQHETLQLTVDLAESALD